MLPFNGSLKSLSSKVKSALARGDIDIALRLVHNLVERVVTEPICTAQVFASRDLDNLCMQIGRQNLHGLTALRVNPWPNRRTGSIVVHLVSRLQRSGGHSRLTQDFINAQPEKNHLVLSTELGGQSDRNYYAEHFANYENVLFLCAPRGNFATRLTWLQEILLFSTPEYVYLLNHHQDSVAIAALVPELVTKGSFIHHADHHLCLGVHLNHLVHVDLHPMGFHYCRDELGVANRYLPLTFEDKCCVPMQTDFMHGGCLTTATAARSNKVEIPYYVSYLDTIPDVLKATGGHHIHIGRLTPWGLRRIRSQMRKFGIPKERFVYIEWAPSVWQALQQHRVDVYIASFPYGAGLTLIEAMGAGIPVIMHKHMYSRVLSSLELAYPEAFRWDDPADLLRYLSLLLPHEIEHERKISRLHYEKFHSPEILRAYLKNPTEFDLPVPPLAKDFQPRHDEWAIWTESQLSFFRLWYRFAYRSWRRLRRWVSI
jgi:hypothetical protein